MLLTETHIFTTIHSEEVSRDRKNNKMLDF